MPKSNKNLETTSLRGQLQEDMAESIPSEEYSEYLQIICAKLRCTPAQALTIVLKEKAHALTCRHSHQQYQQEVSRH